MFRYGMSKVLGTQFPFPRLSHLMTPLGDYPARGLFWTFIGYSRTYECFGGVAEVVGALLLFFRRTTTFGSLVVSAVMLQVLMLNLSYDVHVKLDSLNLVAMALFLLVPDFVRLTNLFILNRATTPVSFGVAFGADGWMKRGRIAAKGLLIGYTVSQ
jgi:hypothetical protein